MLLEKKQSKCKMFFLFLANMGVLLLTPNHQDKKDICQRRNLETLLYRKCLAPSESLKRNIIPERAVSNLKTSEWDKECFSLKPQSENHLENQNSPARGCGRDLEPGLERGSPNLCNQNGWQSSQDQGWQYGQWPPGQFPGFESGFVIGDKNKPPTSNPKEKQTRKAMHNERSVYNSPNVSTIQGYKYL